MFDIDFDKLFKTVFDTMSAHVSSIGGIVSGIVGLGALFYFATKTWAKLARGEPIDLYPVVRPAVIVFLCLYFQTIVITPTQYVLSPLRTYTNGLVVKMQNDNKNKLQAHVNKAKEDREAAIKAQPDRKWYEKIMDAIAGVWQDVKDWLFGVIISIFSFLKYVIYIIMNCLRLFFLCFLGMVGPIAFALSLFPSFEGSLSNWYAKYVSIYLWAPICNIITILLTQIESVFIDKMNVINDAAGIGMVAILIVFYILGAYAYLSLPTLASWVVQGGANAMELAPMLRGANKAALMAGGVMGAAGGNVAGRTGNIAGAAASVIDNKVLGGRGGTAVNSVKNALSTLNRVLGGGRK